MDLNTSISQIKRVGNYYHIGFPSIVGICEGIFYQHNGTHIRNQVEQIHGISFGDIAPEVDAGFLMSRIFGYTIVRCLDFDKPYKSNIIILRHGELYSFKLRSSYYYVLLYTDIYGKVSYFTNFESNPLFYSGFEDGVFTLYNRGLGSIVFQKHYSHPDDLTPYIDKIDGDNYTIWITQDPIHGDTEIRQILDLLRVLDLKASVKTSNNSVFIEITANNKDELLKLAGILGTHQVILGDDSLSGFLSRDDVTQFKIENARDFSLSNSINIFDEGWYTMRKNILSLTYLLETLRLQQQALDGAIDEIDSLQSIHLELQKKRSTMTLEDIRDSITIVENQLHLLIELVANRIS